jgi:muramidase (phage lysozyme)
MPRISVADAGGQNVVAFLSMITRSEIGEELISLSDGGYNLLVGSTPKAPRFFASYADHPLPNPPGIEYRPGAWSTAAGGHQILSKYWPYYQRSLNLPDFSPVSQDRYAIQQIRECRALPLLDAGNFAGAVRACNHIWASLTGSAYGQHTNPLDLLQRYYVEAGGVVRT